MFESADKKEFIGVIIDQLEDLVTQEICPNADEPFFIDNRYDRAAAIINDTIEMWKDRISLQKGYLSADIDSADENAANVDRIYICGLDAQNDPQDLVRAAYDPETDCYRVDVYSDAEDDDVTHSFMIDRFGK